MFEYSDNEYIKLNRKILNWEWYTDVNTCHVFIYCLLRANWKSGKWHGQPYLRGQFITSLPKMAKDVGLSIQSLRTSINHLISTGELTSKAYTKFRVITVVNYDEYQSINRQANSQLTDNQQTTNRQLTADIRINKNNKNEKKSTSPLTGPEKPKPMSELIDEMKSEGYE